ncbi:arylsulfatase [Chitinophaga filiformis]|uniref:arylsulfatase n=1 Tax=Chitinophaga filiformis TaxID=104663 RepID=UPI001F356DA1|nr:arylsulfatase [Chitinophaga filiformis]MCF6406343.1 arylsulfatase [Chitinophaga filiformis]
MRRKFWMAVLTGSAMLVGMMAEGQTRKPNIIFIIADDLGYGNLSCYNPGSIVKTPNIDKLGQEGIRFTDFYSGSTVCAPSRCALLTGKHMGHAYIRGNSRLPLRMQDSTLAQLLQQNGYRTGMFGKWGLGEEGTTGSPEVKGFDTFFGYLNQQHAHNYYSNYLFEVKNGKMSRVPHDTTVYTQDEIMAHAVSFIRDNKDAPFFLFLPFTLPHAELAPPAADMQAFQNADGTSKLGPETPYQRNGGTYRSQPQPHAALAAMIARLDRNVGEITALVKQLGLDDNTYIFFTSDNGPHKEGGADPEYFNSNGPLRGIKRDLYEGGIRVPMLVRAPGKVSAGQVSSIQWAFWDILPTLTDLTHSTTLSGIDGLSYSKALNGSKPGRQHDYFYWQFNEGGLKEAVLKGDWKLIRFKRQGTAARFELYRLSSDIGEAHDLAAKYPKKVKELSRLMLQSKTPAEHPEFDWSAVEQ